MLFWLTRTGIGISFGVASFLGLLVGLAVVGQTLYAAVTERLREFGTLKALGAAEGNVARFIITQALANAVLGSATGLLSAVVVGRLMSTVRAPVVTTAWVAAVSVVLVTLVCLVAAALPYWRIRNLDPASVLRS
jgi:putative ABC transport system permease protein